MVEGIQPVQRLVRTYVVVAVGTVVALAVLQAVDASLATSHAWGHALIVAVFAVLLPLRLRAARAGRRSGLRAVGIISGVLVAVNVVEASIPGFLPTWMRLEMVGVALLMVAIVSLVIRAAMRTRRSVSAISAVDDRW
jgi:hypothetical protein